MSDWKKAAELDKDGNLIYVDLPKDADLCLVYNRATGVVTGPTFWSEVDRAWTDLLGPNGSRVSGAINPPDADEYWMSFVLPTPEEMDAMGAKPTKKAAPSTEEGAKKKAPASSQEQLLAGGYSEGPTDKPSGKKK